MEQPRHQVVVFCTLCRDFLGDLSRVDRGPDDLTRVFRGRRGLPDGNKNIKVLKKSLPQFISTQPNVRCGILTNVDDGSTFH